MDSELVKGGAIPVLVLDKEYFEQAMKTNGAQVEDIMNQLEKKRGGIYVMDGLNKEATEVTKALSEDVIKYTDQPPKGYFKY